MRKNGDDESAQPQADLYLAGKVWVRSPEKPCLHGIHGAGANQDCAFQGLSGAISDAQRNRGKVDNLCSNDDKSFWMNRQLIR